MSCTQLATAAGRIGLPLHVAAAFAEQESGGRNIYGHDAGGVFSKPGVNVPVTKANFAEFFEQVVVLVGDALFHALWQRSGQSADDMWPRHANLE